MGNSEVGHLNIGAGRIVYQDFARINRAIEEGTLAKNPVLSAQIERILENDSDFHLFGLLSDGGVHSHINHLKSLIEAIEALGVKNVYVHGFLDGRDTDPQGGADYIQDLEDFLQERQTKLVSIVGRYYAMDRDNRWERIKKAYDLLVNGIGKNVASLSAAVSEAYQDGTTDEFMEPLITGGIDSAVRIKNGDAVLCFNFRTDRPRQISMALSQIDLPDHGMQRLDIDYVTMTRYDKSFEGVGVLFEKDNLQKTLGEMISSAGKTQVRIAETEKYPHVTYFFSGGQEEPFEKEDRILVNSPKVATYDLAPAMSAAEITDKIVAYVEDGRPDFVCLNYANADMVGHTGDFAATQSACQAVDRSLHTLIPILLKNDYAILIIADHGNADYMINEDGSPNTAHTKNPVPCILIGNDLENVVLRNGKLADIAPTLLHLMKIDVPEAMTGENLMLT